MNKFTKWLIGLGVIASIIFIAAWILRFWDSSFSSDPANWGVFGDYIGGTLATILAAGSFLGLMWSVIQQRHAMEREWALRDDESYAKQATICFERAYNKINPFGDRRPIRDRLAWLECGRLILTAENLGKQINSGGFMIVYESEREHWRGKFRDILEPKGMFVLSEKPNYFEKGELGDEIEHRSVYVIYSFATWQDNRPDIMESVDYNWNFRKISMTYEGARKYLANFHIIKGQHKKDGEA